MEAQKHQVSKQTRSLGYIPTKKNPQCDSRRCTEPLGGPDSAGSDSSDMVKPCFPGWANTVGDPCCKQSLTGYTQLTFINTSWGFPLVWGNTQTIYHQL